jgi:hypothetical protein
MDINLPGKGPVQGGVVGTQGSMSAAGAPWAAMAGVGGDISQLGDKAMDFLVKQQRVKNVQMANEMEMAAAEMFGQFENEMRTNPNPDQWTGQWSQRLEDFQKQFVPDNLAPEQKAMIGERYSNFATRTTLQVAEMATVTGIGQARLTGENRRNQAIRLGDYDAGLESLEMDKEAGLLSLPEFEAKLAEFDRQFETESVNGLVEEDPMVTLSELQEKNEDGTWKNFTGLEPHDRKRAISQAEAQIQEYRQQEMDLLDLALDSGTLQPKDIEAANYLSETDRKRWAQALEASDPPSSEVHSQAWDILFENRERFADPSLTDAEYAKQWNDMRSKMASLIPKQYAGDINQELSYRSPANRKAVRSNPPGYNDPQELKTMGYNQLKRARDAGMFGDISEEADKKTREEAYWKEARYRLDVSKFLKQNRDATAEQIEEFTDKLITGDRGAKAINLMKPALPGYGMQSGATDILLPPMDGDLDAELDAFLNHGN